MSFRDRKVTAENLIASIAAEGSFDDDAMQGAQQLHEYLIETHGGFDNGDKDAFDYSKCSPQEQYEYAVMFTSGPP